MSEKVKEEQTFVCNLHKEEKVKEEQTFVCNLHLQEALILGGLI